MGVKHRGAGHPRWKGGWRNNLPYCLDCNKKLGNYKAKYCIKCFWEKHAEDLYKNKNRVEELVEQTLNKLFPRHWKFVGNGKCWIGRKNPDFVNINGKKELIEVFGDYWHFGENPQVRINHFQKYGFRTLVIWEKQVKDGSYINEIKNFVIIERK